MKKTVAPVCLYQFGSCCVLGSNRGTFNEAFKDIKFPILCSISKILPTHCYILINIIMMLYLILIGVMS